MDEISLSDEEYFVSESEGEFSVVLERRSTLIEPASVLLQSRTQFTENTAQGTYNFTNRARAFLSAGRETYILGLRAPEQLPCYKRYGQWFPMRSLEGGGNDTQAGPTTLYLLAKSFKNRVLIGCTSTYTAGSTTDEAQHV